MPASITHAYFALDIFHHLPLSIQKQWQGELTKYKMFAQGTDPLIFYHILNPKSKINGSELQKYLHNTSTQVFFIELTSTIKRKNLTTNQDVLAFLYGMISHYLLDSTIHPYIIYHSGYYDKKKKETYHYRNNHDIMENYIDMELVKRKEEKNPYSFSFASFIFEKPHFSHELIDLIDSVYENVYHIKKMSKIYQESLQGMIFWLRLLRKDRFGIKKASYRLVDKFTPKGFFRLESISYHVSLTKHAHLLNENHKIWYDPTTKQPRTESFFDLYQKAQKEGENIFCLVDSYLHGKNIDLHEVFDNRSYVSGLDCSLDLNFKYFKDNV